MQLNLDLKNISPNQNILPCDGEAYYHGHLFEHAKANDLLQCLLKTIAWNRDEVVLYGKQYQTKREVAWYGNKRYPYTYSNVTKHAQAWTHELLEIKEAVERKTNETFNSCLLNLYHDGHESMGWHSDDEKDLKRWGAIASVSLGAERKFCFKHKKNKEKKEIFLEHGSLLVMKGKTQDYWRHSLPATVKVDSVRVNLTFRMMEA